MQGTSSFSAPGAKRFSCALPCVVWHDDHEAIYIHLQDPGALDHQEDGGNIILDVTKDGYTQGIEVLSAPTGSEEFDGGDLTNEQWVLVSKAWERAQIARRDSKGAHRGEFTIQ